MKCPKCDCEMQVLIWTWEEGGLVHNRSYDICPSCGYYTRGDC